MTRSGSLKTRLEEALSYGESLAIFQFPIHSFLKERGETVLVSRVGILEWIV